MGEKSRAPKNLDDSPNGRTANLCSVFLHSFCHLGLDEVDGDRTTLLIVER